METRLSLPLSFAAAAAALAVPGAAHAAPAHAADTTYRLTDCRVDTIPLHNPTTGDFIGYVTMGRCEGTGSYYATVDCPDGTTHIGNTVTLPGPGTTTSFTGCGTEYPLSQSLVILDQG